MEKIIRSACKALILNNGFLLTTKKINDNCVFYVLPGGGQKWDETLKQTLIRECVEELNVEPYEIGKIVFIREGFNYVDQTNAGNYCHRLDFIFECKIDVDTIGKGTDVDLGYTENVWLEVDRLNTYNFLPKGLIPYIISYKNGEKLENVYIGKID
jgi:8-oxo-dGTP pyrophosphatase MutT (NUDIX family)